MSAERAGPACRTFSIAIREARSEQDLATVSAIYERSGRASFTWRPRDYFQAALFPLIAKDETIFVAEFGQSIVGFLSFYREGNFVHSLYVDPDAQGLGVGRALVRHVHTIAGAPLTLKLDEPNKAAIAFYEKTGWRRLGGPDDSGVDEAGITWLRYRLD